MSDPVHNSGPASTVKRTYTGTKIALNERPLLFTKWYGSNRPMTGYRKKLDSSCVLYGEKMALLKNGCNTCRGPAGSKFGNVISFGGGSGIRSATTIVSPRYYSNTASYLRSRGQTYYANATIHRAPGINYIQNNGPVLPSVPQTSPLYPFSVNSAYFAMTTSTECPSSLAVYKPNNPTFATQGAVSSSARLLKLKTGIENSPHLTAYEKKQKLKLPDKAPCCKRSSA